MNNYWWWSRGIILKYFHKLKRRSSNKLIKSHKHKQSSNCAESAFQLIVVKKQPKYCKKSYGKEENVTKEITKRSKLPDVQGKVRDQVAIGFRLGSGWPRVWCKFLKSITEHNRATLIQSWTGGDTQLKIKLLDCLIAANQRPETLTCILYDWTKQFHLQWIDLQ